MQTYLRRFCTPGCRSRSVASCCTHPRPCCNEIAWYQPIWARLLERNNFSRVNTR